MCDAVQQNASKVYKLNSGHLYNVLYYLRIEMKAVDFSKLLVPTCKLDSLITHNAAVLSNSNVWTSFNSCLSRVHLSILGWYMKLKVMTKDVVFGLYLCWNGRVHVHIIFTDVRISTLWLCIAVMWWHIFLVCLVQHCVIGVACVCGQVLHHHGSTCVWWSIAHILHYSHSMCVCGEALHCSDSACV